MSKFCPPHCGCSSCYEDRQLTDSICLYLTRKEREIILGLMNKYGPDNMELRRKLNGEGDAR